MLQMLTPFVAPGLKKQPSKGRRSSGFMDMIIEIICKNMELI